MRISHIRLENWRNFRRVDAPLQRRTFLAGPNASGKSNFLDAFRFLQDLSAVSGGLQKAVTARGSVSKIRCLAARRSSDVVIDVSLGDDDTDTQWRYKIVFNQDNLRRPILKEEIVFKGRDVILSRPDVADREDPERLTQTFLEQVNANKHFRDIQEFLVSIKYLHLVPHLIRDPDRYAPRINDPFGGDFLEQLASAPTRTRESRLKRIGEALQIAVPQLRELQLTRDDRGVPHLEGRFEHWRPNAGWQREDQFSDGTLRLLGLLWAVTEGTGPLLLEEPELSLHPGVIRYIPQMLWRVTRKTRRQVLLSTHSVDLLSDDNLGADEIFLFHPTENGTEILPASKDKMIQDLMERGESIGDVILQKIAPPRSEQLALFENA
jgi:predicted ATPase